MAHSRTCHGAAQNVNLFSPLCCTMASEKGSRTSEVCELRSNPESITPLDCNWVGFLEFIVLVGIFTAFHFEPTSEKLSAEESFQQPRPALFEVLPFAYKYCLVSLLVSLLDIFQARSAAQSSPFLVLHLFQLFIRAILGGLKQIICFRLCFNILLVSLEPYHWVYFPFFPPLSGRLLQMDGASLSLRLPAASRGFAREAEQELRLQRRTEEAVAAQLAQRKECGDAFGGGSGGGDEGGGVGLSHPIFWKGEGSHTKIDYRKKGTLIPTSLPPRWGLGFRV